jgi:hypothetical protein
VEISCRIYRPRRARESPLYRLVEQHIEEFLRVYPERFAKEHGPLRPVVERVLREFIRCGIPEHGFGRAYCDACRATYVVPSSCRIRSFRPSCEKKHALLWPEWLSRDLLAAVSHRHELLVTKLKAWRHPGFSAFVGQPIAPENRAALEDIAAYLLRPPLSLDKLVYLDGKQAVLYRSKMHPGLGRNFEAVDPLEWLARMTDHIPDPGKHRTLFYGAYATRTRGARESKEPGPYPPPKRKRCTPSWARLISKVYGADPLICRRCGQKLRIIAYITDSLSIKQILDHLGLWPAEDDKPPPAPPELRTVPVDEDGREIGEAR